MKYNSQSSTHFNKEYMYTNARRYILDIWLPVNLICLTYVFVHGVLLLDYQYMV